VDEPYNLDDDTDSDTAGRAVSGTFPPLTARQLRDIVAVLMILTGVIGLVFLAFTIDVRIGIATLCVALIATGVLLGTER
jgi:hypothetical protein